MKNKIIHIYLFNYTFVKLVLNKMITESNGIYLIKKNCKILGFMYPLPGEKGILYEQQTQQKDLPKILAFGDVANTNIKIKIFLIQLTINLK